MAKPTILVDNKKVKVTEWFFEIGDSTGQHIHEHDYVVVPMLDGELKIIDRDKKISGRIRFISIFIIFNHVVF